MKLTELPDPLREWLSEREGFATRHERLVIDELSEMRPDRVLDWLHEAFLIGRRCAAPVHALYAHDVEGSTTLALFEDGGLAELVCARCVEAVASRPELTDNRDEQGRLLPGFSDAQIRGHGAALDAWRESHPARAYLPQHVLEQLWLFDEFAVRRLEIVRAVDASKTVEYTPPQESGARP